MSIHFADYVRLSIPEGSVTKITRKSDGVVLWSKGYVNQVPISIDADGSIYNGCGYKEGYRIRSGGAESSYSGAVCTGFIPFRQGDILRIYPAFTGRNTDNAINFADSSFANLGQVTNVGACYGICATDTAIWQAVDSEVDGVTVIDISAATNAAEVAYIRVTNIYGEANDGEESAIASGAELIVTVNEEIR